MPGRAVLNRTATTNRFFSENHLKWCFARQDADCADGNKDVRIEATLLIQRQQAKSNPAVKSCRKTALIWLCDLYKRCGSSPIDRMPRRGHIACLGSDLNQNSNLHRMSQHRAIWTESGTALSERNARGVRCIERANPYFAWYIDPQTAACLQKTE